MPQLISKLRENGPPDDGLTEEQKRIQAEALAFREKYADPEAEMPEEQGAEEGDWLDYIMPLRGAGRSAIKHGIKAAVKQEATGVAKRAVRQAAIDKMKNDMPVGQMSRGMKPDYTGKDVSTAKSMKSLSDRERIDIKRQIADIDRSTPQGRAQTKQLEALLDPTLKY